MDSLSLPVLFACGGKAVEWESCGGWFSHWREWRGFACLLLRQELLPGCFGNLGTRMECESSVLLPVEEQGSNACELI